MLIFYTKENESAYNRQLICQQIYIMNVLKTKYIPLYISENEVFLRSGNCRS